MAGAELQGLALEQVMDWLPTEDVVSVGQVCRSWRRVAREPSVWRFRYAPDLNRQANPSERNRFWRVVKFAPYVRKMSVEQPEGRGRLQGKWATFYEQLGNEISIKARGLRIRFGLEGTVTQPWVHRMLRRLAAHLDMLEVENPGPEDEVVIRDLILRDGPGPRILHTRTWTDKLHGVEAWPVGERPALDVLHISLVFAGSELVRVLGRTASRLELEVDTDRVVATSAPAPTHGERSSQFPLYESEAPLNIWQLQGGHVREVALLRTDSRRHEAAQCAEQIALVRTVLPDATITCSVCAGARLCRC